MWESPRLSPCGFCFVVFESRHAAVAARAALDRTLLDDRLVHVDWDVGFQPAEIDISSTTGSANSPPLTAVYTEHSTTSASPQQGEPPTPTQAQLPHEEANRGRGSGATAAAVVKKGMPVDPLSRRWGRGANGKQVVDGVRPNMDEGRGGLGTLRQAAVVASVGGAFIRNKDSAGAGGGDAGHGQLFDSVAAYRLAANWENSIEGGEDVMAGEDMMVGDYYWITGPSRRGRAGGATNNTNNFSAKVGGGGFKSRRRDGDDDTSFPRKRQRRSG